MWDQSEGKFFSTNNNNNLIYPRSSIKIFQGIPFADSNAINLYNLSKKQIALSCSSHCGQNFHIKELKAWIKINLSTSDLKCGVHNPLNKDQVKNFLSGKSLTSYITTVLANIWECYQVVWQIIFLLKIMLILSILIR